MTIVIYGGTIVNEGRAFEGSVLIQDDRITSIIEGKKAPCGHYDKQVDATGCFVLPGIIDEHVHFREPGLTAKADIDSESRAAAYGGVTSFFDMPNTVPQTTSLETLLAKHELGRQHSHVNYTFIFGATNQNADLIPTLNLHQVPAIKLFMGASTGNMLVDRRETLEQIFRTCPFPIIAHCEDSTLINANMQAYKQRLGEQVDISLHPIIRSEAACYKSTALAVALAKKYGTRLHVAHLTTAKELTFFGSDDNITAEAVIPHLMFYDDDYKTLKSLIKCNPAIKTKADREALRRALTTGEIHTVATDHAPHLLPDKQGGACTAASGMPMVQFSLPTMLELVDAGVLTIERLVTLMCHHPALLFDVNERGFLRKNYKADITIVKPNMPWTVTESVIQSKCKWSPMAGHTYQWKVMQTFCNGHLVYGDGVFDEDYRGEALCFRR